jgi:phosphonate transport system substrate-binding protein
MIAAKDRSALAVKVIDSSVDFGMPPVVVPHQLDAQLKTQLRDIFLTIHESTQGRAILDNLCIDHFTLADDHEYDLIREMGRTCKR